MQLERCELRQPDQGGLVVADHEVDLARPVEAHASGLHPVGSALRGTLLVEPEPVDAVREAHEGSGRPARCGRSVSATRA